jgi:probable rRNA maturation factor
MLYMILNRQRAIRVSVPPLEKFLARVQSRLRIAPESLSVALVTNNAIAKWNSSYRGKSKPTDVLSFPAVTPDEPAPPSLKKRAGASGSAAEKYSYLGDIAIAPAVARANARRFGRTFDAEMRILILHGVLHLMGYDHETDSGQMERRERGLRRELGLA